jgi:protein-S-isoprenylcysteine O-methyltransferase Ste14
MSLSDRMIAFVYRWATGPAGKRWPVSVVGMLAFLAMCVVVIWGSTRVDVLIGLRVTGFSTLRQILGWPLVAFGFILMYWTLIFFIRERGTPFPLNPPRNLITSGPYGITRNPMLGGGFISFFGIGLLLGSVTLFLVATPLLVLLFTIFVKRIEEPELTKRFGDDYVQYQKQVPRFFPKFQCRLQRH